jgi:hypothetical protein
MDIAEALKAKGYEIDRRKIVLKDAIKETAITRRRQTAPRSDAWKFPSP